MPTLCVLNDFTFFNVSEECHVVSLDALLDIVEACQMLDSVGCVIVRLENEEDEGLEEDGYKGDELPPRLRLEGMGKVSMDCTSKNTYVTRLIILPVAICWSILSHCKRWF